MSDKNMDKDIDVLKNMFYEDETFEPNDYVEIFFHKNEQLAIKNILSELENKDKKLAEYRKFHDRRLKEWKKKFEKQEKHFLNELDEHDKELETYKKIAEFLAKNSVVRAKCERCVEDLDENGCIRCMLNWAKSEVLKDE